MLRPLFLLALTGCASTALDTRVTAEPSTDLSILAGDDSAASPPRAEANDNRAPGGELKDGTLRIHLVARMSTWYPEAEDGPFKVVEAFGEAGQAPRIPGPLIRVPLGTTIQTTLTNSLSDTIAVLGLQGRNDSIRLAPGESRQVRSTPDAAGTYLYRAGLMLGGKFVTKGSQQLVGGLIVDSGPPSTDRIFIATAWDPTPYFLAMNGKSWPYTEKFVHTVGDTVRWRVINGGEGTGAHHPMHLHGFYYRVDTRGGWDADTLYAENARRWVVTETLGPLASMTMTWIPERPGNWLFHCHNSDHVAGRNRHNVAGSAKPFPESPTHDATEHMAWDMSGLVTAITILPRGGGAVAAEPAPVNPRRMRLLIQERAGVNGRQPGYGYVLQAGTEPAADSISIPGPRLVLRRNEPVEITVVNRIGNHTAVHWHGIELESFYDGVAGWSGAGERLAPMIAPADSFIVRFTPPRAGTFIYHAHITDYVQIARGLYGALLVVDEPPADGADHVAIVSFGRLGGKASLLLNGSLTPAPIERNQDGRQRVRLINISTENGAIVTLSDGDALTNWRAVAKDGFDLPVGQRRMAPASVHIFPGETYDFEFESSAPVLRLRMRNPNLTEGDEATLELRTRP
jgi:FtsP/CotA-like multicopper oxidase with cupredoxin domain